MAKVIELVFQDSDGYNTTITLDSPKADITADQVRTAMNAMIAQNVLVSNKDAALTVAYRAGIVTTTKEELAI